MMSRCKRGRHKGQTRLDNQKQQGTTETSSFITHSNHKKGLGETGGQITRTTAGYAQVAGITTLALGTLALTTSIVSTSTILALIGLGLIFWGAILLYIQKPDYVPTAILDASVSSFTDTLNQITQALDYKGNPVYLPPKYFENPEDTRVFIPKQKDGPHPTPEQTQENKNQPLITNPAGMLLTPPGTDLARLFEKTLETSFTRVDLEYLKQHMPKLLIEDLEIATSLEIQTETAKIPERPNDTASQAEAKHNRIQVKITTTAYQNTCKQAAQYPITVALSCPLTSAIACAIAKATGKPTTIENQEISRDGTAITVEYRLIEEEPTQQ